MWNQFVVDEAIDLTSRHRLRGYDAIHLACALRLNRALGSRLFQQFQAMIEVINERYYCR
jgi:hypothetical protein